jgi:hypothetical protein
MIDENLKAWMLEVNDHPSLNIYHDQKCEMEHKEYTDDDICQVDMYVKSRVTLDTINLAQMSIDEISNIDSFGSLTRLHPTNMSNW